MEKNNEQLISFLHEPDNAWVTPIIPASKALPDWYKRLPVRTEELQPWDAATVKSCMPFFDAMVQGYVMPLWADLHVKTESTKKGNPSPTFTWGIYGDTVVERHTPLQTGEMPAMEESLGHSGAFKIMSPWIIKTPPGYSSLFIAPLNNSPKYMNFVSAIVSTDSYNNYINFPFIWTGPEDWTGIISQGTPIIQIIPFKRVNFKHEVRAFNASEDWSVRSTARALRNAFTHPYKRVWRKPTRSV